ncbi:MAG: ORF6N domain-containing protein [Verrucomicrobia bacterium]|nr:ORF6N domain-containing protein [Verrucomicrobiota bacterium]
MPAKKAPATKRTPAATGSLLVPEKLAPLVHYLRHEKVILDSDLAELYGVETKVLNQAVQRNRDRFPVDFMFQLTDNEMEISRSQSATSNATPSPLRSQIVTLKRGQHRKYLPYAFTEQGVAMLSSVLRSPRAVKVNIAIMRTFVQLRRLMDSNALLAEKIEALEEKYADHDQHFQLVFEAIKQLIATPPAPAKELGFHTIPSARSPRKSTRSRL